MEVSLVVICALVSMTTGQHILSPLFKGPLRTAAVYSGLFWSEQRISSLQTRLRDKKEKIYRLSSARTKLEPLSVTCGSAQARPRPGCGSSEVKVTLLAQTCCHTVQEIIQPELVTGIIDDVTYNVTVTALGVQILHVGRCTQEWSSCGQGGQCLQENRLAWVLVDSGQFVPVEVPSHCVCIYV